MADTIKIGAFFDGTGNHRDNDTEIGDGSITNIGKIVELYNGTVLYKEGVGTRDLSKQEIIQIQNNEAEKNDFYSSLEMGTAFEIDMDNQVVQRAECMLKNIQDIVNNNPNTKIEVDSFGYSRGASSNRHFVNIFNEYFASNPNVSIGFVGLFDTVASVGLANEYNYNTQLDLNADSAQNVFQITANDEKRSNFPLESLTDKYGNLPSNFKETGVFGVHATTGGGNKEHEEETLVVSSGLFTYASVIDRANQLQKLIEHNRQNGFEIIINNDRPNFYTLSYTVVLKREVSSDLSDVYLKLMLKEAQKSGVTFTDTNITIADGLQDFANDLLDGNDVSQYESYLQQYIHTSHSNDKIDASFIDLLAHFKDFNGERNIYYGDVYDNLYSVSQSIDIDTLYSVGDILNNEYNDYLENTTKPLETSSIADWLLNNKTPINIDSNDTSVVSVFGDLGIKKVSIENQTYTIQSGDTLWGIANKYQITLEELLASNQWLSKNGRISDDGSYALIKPNKTIVLPINALENSLIRLNGDPFTYNPANSFQIIQSLDPLALDMNTDGLIATTTVQESETNFDLTGDGIKERTGWIKSEDALLVYDKNEDGKIGGISEVFGNATTEGFDELRDTVDSNYDNKIDRRDVLYNRLKIWHDHDQDGNADEGELTYLKDAGIESINLNSVVTDIKTNGHTISQASRYTNTKGDKELIADIHLAYVSRITTIDPTLIKDFSIDVTTLNLPTLRGYVKLKEYINDYMYSKNSMKEVA